MNRYRVRLEQPRTGAYRVITVNAQCSESAMQQALKTVGSGWTAYDTVMLAA